MLRSGAMSPIRHLQTLAWVSIVALTLPSPLTAKPTPLDSRFVHPSGAMGRPLEPIGSLQFRAGYSFRSQDENFGGFSGLDIDCATGHVVAVSDRGWYLAARLVLASDGTLRGLAEPRLEPLLDFDGQPVEGRMRHDAEEITRIPEGWLVSFEGEHRIAAYGVYVPLSARPDGAPGGEGPSAATPPTDIETAAEDSTDVQLAASAASDASPTLEPDGVPQPLPTPSGLEATDENKGLEAMTRLLDGRLVLITEGLRTTPQTVAGWVGAPGHWQRFELVATEEFQPTAAATLPTGDVLLQERHYDPDSDTVRIRLSRLEASSLQQDARIESQELGRFEPPLLVDNMEALAVCPADDGGVLVYLMSDDNFSDSQQTLLYQLVLPAPR